MNDTPPMNYRLVPLDPVHRQGVVEIFNHYTLSGHAVLSEVVWDGRILDLFLGLARGYPALAVENDQGEAVGFGLLRRFHPAANFNHTAELIVYLHPDHTQKGVGHLLVSALTRAAAAQGLTMLLVMISSRNPPSVAFFAKEGFSECGRFLKVGRKFEEDFDLVWMQKPLDPGSSPS